MATVQVTGLQVISIFVDDLKGAREFYIEHLGFRLENENATCLTMSIEGLKLFIEGGRQSQFQDRSQSPDVNPCFAVASVKNAHAALQSAGVKIVGDYVEFTPEFALFKFADPAGNVFEVAGLP